MPTVTKPPYPSRYFEAPTPWTYPDSFAPEPTVFLAGGITNCEDWQSYARELLNPRWTIFNPRRADFDVTDPTASETQIKWEFEFLQRASLIIFWFAGGPSPQPITLYEFGRHLALNSTPILVGADDRYSRRSDVVTQYRLARPHRWHYVYPSLEELCAGADDYGRFV